MASRSMGRRDLIKAAGLAVAAIPGAGSRSAATAPLQTASAPAAGKDPWRGLKAGVASYTLRKLKQLPEAQRLRKLA